MMKILTVVGARPQFIKAAVVSRALQAESSVSEVLVHTGQHYDANMSDVFFEDLGLSLPQYYLGIGSGRHGWQTGRMLEAIEEVLIHEKPDFVLVYGDTNSTLASALAAVKLHIPVAHVEAGLRSFNRVMPEETNRVVTDHIATLLFAPTETAVCNLRREGIAGDAVRLTGDVMYDAALQFAAEASRRMDVLQRAGVEPGTYVLATVHRAENTDAPQRLSSIIRGLAKVAQTLPVVLPLHPRTQLALERDPSLQDSVARLTTLEAVGYLDMTCLEKHASIIATDSGGVQKEAYFQRVPCITLREETEWLELLQSGWNELVPPFDPRVIADAVIGKIQRPGKDLDLFGGGQAAARIARTLAESAAETFRFATA